MIVIGYHYENVRSPTATVLRILAWITVWVLFWMTGVETFVPSLVLLVLFHVVAIGFDLAAINREKKRIAEALEGKPVATQDNK